MKSIKIKLVFTLFLIIIGFNSKSQIYKAGDMLSTYVNINPDTLINYTCSPAGSTEDYYIDVNGDSQNDFQIEAHCNTYMAGTASDEYIDIISLNPNSYIRFGRIDSSYILILLFGGRQKLQNHFNIVILLTLLFQNGIVRLCI